MSHDPHVGWKNFLKLQQTSWDVPIICKNIWKSAVSFAWKLHLSDSWTKQFFGRMQNWCKNHADSAQNWCLQFHLIKWWSSQHTFSATMLQHHKCLVNHDHCGKAPWHGQLGTKTTCVNLNLFFGRIFDEWSNYLVFFCGICTQMKCLGDSFLRLHRPCILAMQSALGYVNFSHIKFSVKLTIDEEYPLQP